jgi:hypothetical protein
MDIELVRPKQFQNKIRNYHLYVDGKKITELTPNSSQVVSIPDYSKYIQAKIDWCSSPKYYLDGSSSKKLIVKNSMDGGLLKTLILPVYNITFGKNKYLAIEDYI